MNRSACLAALLLPCLIAGAQETAPLDSRLQTNGSVTLGSLSLLQSTARTSVVQVLTSKGETQQLGVVVSTDGYLITKASEVPNSGNLKIAWPDGTQSEATVLLIDRSVDLLLAKAARENTIPVTWATAKDSKAGQWVTAFSKPEMGAPALRLGVVSARRRGIPGRGAGLGVRMEDDRMKDLVRIVDVASESPAAAAGLKKDDLILSLDDQPVNTISSVKQLIERYQPGQEVSLHIRRGSAEKRYNVRLASLSKVVANWDGEDYANGGVSLRTDGFTEIVQHEVPLSPHDMGGPLIDLDGKVIGLNIARVDRVTTFALPAESIASKIEQWIVTDRKFQQTGDPAAAPTAAK